MIAEERTAKAKIKTKTLPKKARFEFLAPEAHEAYLAGDFNNWDTCANLMKKDMKGIWKAVLSLEPGKYEYRFFVDGSWENDPVCCDCVPNKFGSQNCVRIVE